MNQSVENLARTWQSIDELCSDLDEVAWKTETACPGWTVQDNVAHLIDYESRALGHSGPEHLVTNSAPVKNPLGESNEIGVDYRRGRAGAEVLAEFRSITAERLVQLRGLTPDDLAKEAVTPAGPGTVADMLNLRVMDSWSHEQDIRRALGRPGHLEGPVVEQAIAYFTTMLPYVVGKRAQAPDGATVVFAIDGFGDVVVEVAGGRAKRVDAPPADPSVTIATDVGTFAALVNGRTTSTDGVTITGEADLGQRVVAAMGVMV